MLSSAVKRGDVTDVQLSLKSEAEVEEVMGSAKKWKMVGEKSQHHLSEGVLHKVTIPAPE